MMQQGTNMSRGMGTSQQGMGMQQQSMNQMACTTIDEFDHAMQMWSQVLQGAQGCPDVETEARAQLGALDTWRNALQHTLSRAQSGDPNTQQMAQNDLMQTCAKAHTAVMLAEQTFLQEYGQAQDELLSNIGMGSIMGGMGEQTQQPWQQQQQQYQPSYQSTGTMGRMGMRSQYGQQQYQPSYQQQQYQPSYQSSMGSQYGQQTGQRGMQTPQFQPSYQSNMGRQQSYAQQARGPYSQAVSQIPYSQPGMSFTGEAYGPAAFSRGSYFGPMGLQQYGEPVQHERIPDTGSAWRGGSQMGMGTQTQQPWQQQQQYQPSYQSTGTMGSMGMGSQYGQQQYQPSYQQQQYQPSYQSSMGSQYGQQPSYQRGMQSQQPYAQHEPYSQAVSQIPYSQPGMSFTGETFGPAAFSRGSYFGPMGLQQYGEPVQHERIPEAGSAWRGGQMGMGSQTGMQGQMGTRTQSSRGSEQFGTGSQQSRNIQMRQRNW